MYSHNQRLSAPLTRELRFQAGRRLREWREKRGLTQRQLCREVGAERHTFISALEQGRGRIPPDRYLVWAHALGVDPREFVRELMSYYDPLTYAILFGDRNSPAEVIPMPSPNECTDDQGGE
jgi:transcriptional regulator with XRE-family HTH domain